jgi:hypothetical protein
MWSLHTNTDEYLLTQMNIVPYLFYRHVSTGKFHIDTSRICSLHLGCVQIYDASADQMIGYDSIHDHYRSPFEKSFNLKLAAIS